MKNNKLTNLQLNQNKLKKRKIKKRKGLIRKIHNLTLLKWMMKKKKKMIIWEMKTSLKQRTWRKMQRYNIYMMMMKYLDKKIRKKKENKKVNNKMYLKKITKI